MKEVVSSLERSIGYFVNEMSEAVYEFNKRYIIPSAVIGTFILGGFYFAFCPAVKNYLIPTVDQYIRWDNNSFADHNIPKYKKEIKEKNSNVEKKKIIDREMQRINAILDQRLQIEETENLMERLDILGK
ncbi:MAG: hypothetical protein AABX03_02710 [Nanoarchaeota archaeon]